MEDVGAIRSNDIRDRGDDEGSRRTILDRGTSWSAHPWGQTLTDEGALRLVITMFLVAFIILASLVTAIGLFVIHVLENSAVGKWDHGVSLWSIDHGSNFWRNANTDVTFATDKLTVATIALIVTVVLLFHHWERRAFILATSLAIELSVFITANSIVARPRPSATSAEHPQRSASHQDTPLRQSLYTVGWQSW